MTGNEESAISPEPVTGPATLALSMVIPAFNEEMRLEDGMTRLRHAIAAGAIAPGTTEFIIVDDGSTDATAACAGTLFASYPHVKIVRLPENRGKGAAVRAGVAAASAPIIAFADADMAIDPVQTPQFTRALATADVAIGTRTATGASVDRPSFRRSVMSRMFSQLVSTVGRVPVKDTQCGYKAFRAPAAKLLFHCTVTERFAFDVEILSLSRRLGLSITQVPVRWLRVRGSRIRPWTDAPSMIRDIVRAGRGVGKGPAVPALAVTLPGEHSAEVLRQDLPPTLPVLVRPGGKVLVLCPLMSETEIDAVAGQIATRSTDLVLERRTLTLVELCQMAPLSLTWDDDAVASAVP